MKSLFEKYNEENSITLAQKILSVWLIAADNEVNDDDKLLYLEYFKKNDLNEFIKNSIFNKNDIITSISILKDFFNKDDNIDYFIFLIKLSNTNNGIQVYEKVMLDNLSKLILNKNNLELFKNEYKNIIEKDLHPIQNVSSIDSWNKDKITNDDEFLNYYEILKINERSSNREIQDALQKNHKVENNIKSNISYILLDKNKKSLYDKVLNYKKIFNDINNFKIVRNNLPKEEYKLINVITIFVVLLLFSLIFNSLQNYANKNNIDNSQDDIIENNIDSSQDDIIENNIDSSQDDIIENNIDSSQDDIIENNIDSSQDDIKNIKKIVNVEFLNLRSGPSINNNVINVLKIGTIVDVLYERKGWSKIKYNNLTGWVSTYYIDSNYILENNE